MQEDDIERLVRLRRIPQSVITRVPATAGGLTAEDLLCTYAERRVLPLQMRTHKIGHMSGRLDPNRTSKVPLTKAQVASRVNHITKANLAEDWSYGLVPCDRNHPPARVFERQNAEDGDLATKRWTPDLVDPADQAGEHAGDDDLPQAPDLGGQGETGARRGRAACGRSRQQAHRGGVGRESEAPSAPETTGPAGPSAAPGTTPPPQPTPEEPARQEPAGDEPARTGGADSRALVRTEGAAGPSEGLHVAKGARLVAVPSASDSSFGSAGTMERAWHQANSCEVLSREGQPGTAPMKMLFSGYRASLKTKAAETLAQLATLEDAEKTVEERRTVLYNQVVTSYHRAKIERAALARELEVVKATGRDGPITDDPGACTAVPGGTGGHCGPIIADTGGIPATTWAKERDSGWLRDDADDGAVSMGRGGGVMTWRLGGMIVEGFVVTEAA
ncbi:uncharacterized protein [Lolium perenne]|uniref:uncharacterized protein n=1 Tax=Lolium perenne TaxID=4522 RepID=UPI003A98F91B